MTPILTTITPFWCRSQMLPGWVAALKAAWVPGVSHHVYEISKHPRQNFKVFFAEPAIFGHVWTNDDPPKSIGYYHNQAIANSNVQSEWVMKLDVDAIPNPEFFKELLPILAAAKEREWFNAGMFFLKKGPSEVIEKMGLTLPIFNSIVSNRVSTTEGTYPDPQASNFICRRKDYLALGGCPPGFQGWGWEDYAQTYALERHQRGQDPLPGALGINNVTQRCRDEITRPKAKELWLRGGNLCLFHRWHEASNDPTYKSLFNTTRNRQVLLDYINEQRRANETTHQPSMGGHPTA